MLCLKSVQYKKAAKGQNAVMNRTQRILGIVLTIIMISMAQVGGAFAAPASQEAPPIRGTVQSITLESDPTTGVITVIVAVMDVDQAVQKVRLNHETAFALGLVLLDGDGNPVINQRALGQAAAIDPATAIPDQEEGHHPIANALATFFSDIEGMDYEMIMSAHTDGVGFGVIAQTLWLTSELGGDSQLFQGLLFAKKHNDYSAFSDFTEDGTPPKNWGQLRKVLLEKKNLGAVMSNHNNNGNPGNPGNGSGNSQEKAKDKDNKGPGNGNGNNGHGNGNGNGHNN